VRRRREAPPADEPTDVRAVDLVDACCSGSSFSQRFFGWTGSEYIRWKISVRRSFIQLELRFIVRNWRRASMSMMPATNVFAPDEVCLSTFPW
jgi:hypothetical protein